MLTSLLNRNVQFLVPEVVQTSAMDCGPAALKCLLGGFGISANYGRLREAWSTWLAKVCTARRAKRPWAQLPVPSIP